MLTEAQNVTSPDEAFLIDIFINKKNFKSIYAYTSSWLVTVNLQQELEFIWYSLVNPMLYAWRGLTSHLITCLPDFTA